jgi:hypothetical protein
LLRTLDKRAAYLVLSGWNKLGTDVMTIPAQQTDKGAPPGRWRVLVAGPPSGFGAQLGVMRAWLDETCGPSGWASALAGTGGIVNDAVAFYFADPFSARAFVGRFCCGYSAKSRPGL